LIRLRARDRRESSSTLVLVEAIFLSLENGEVDKACNWVNRSKGVWCSGDAELCAALEIALTRIKAEADVFAVGNRSHCPTPMPKEGVRVSSDGVVLERAASVCPFAVPIPTRVSQAAQT
jgi:hypothetical protein